MKKTEQLLNKVGEIAQRSNELSILKGENFNVFQIFNLERDENKMHSRFIETLLNPKGTHERGSVFLKLFLETISQENYFEALEVVDTEVEHHVGKVDISKGEKSTGGRIDIYLWDGKKSISIENKIDAPDQPKQIIRYYNHNKDSNVVYYLTKKGEEPNDKGSFGNLKSNLNESTQEPDFYCISYSETILTWLKKCQKEVSDYPIIRETIKQYIITIKRLTGQLINQEMEKNIKDLIKNNFEEAQIISDNIEHVKKEVIDEFIEDLIRELGKKLEKKEKNIWTINYDDFKDKENTPWKKIRVYHKDWKNISVALEGYPHFLKGSILGVLISEGAINPIEPTKNQEDFDFIKNKYSKNNGCWLYFKSNLIWGKSHDFSILFDVSKRKFLIENKSNELIQLAKSLHTLI